MTESTTAAAIWPYWMPEAVTKARAPTVTGCLSAEARISAKMKLFQAEDEGQQRRRGDARPGQRHGDPDEGAPPGMAVDAVGVLDVRADVLEIAAHDPQDQRQRDQLIDPDQADIGVGEAELLEIEASGSSTSSGGAKRKESRVKAMFSPSRNLKRAKA